MTYRTDAHEAYLVACEREEEGAPASTIDEVIYDQARIDGASCPDVAWLISSWDTWVANPNYHGPAVPHPFDQEAEAELEDCRARARDRKSVV